MADPIPYGFQRSTCVNMVDRAGTPDGAAT
jgi:hypothetical protein